MATTLRPRDFAIAIMHRATCEFAAFKTIQSLGFSFTNPSKRRTAVVGLMFNIEAVLASMEGGTTKRPSAGARTFSAHVNVRNALPHLDAGDPWPDGFHDSCALTSDHGRELRIQKVHSIR